MIKKKDLTNPIYFVILVLLTGSCLITKEKGGNMSVIYEPKGKAREYSPLALNLYSGCDHHCVYCYVKKMRFLKHTDVVKPRENIIEKLTNDVKKYRNCKNQVLLSFTCDPYCQAENDYEITKKALPILAENNIPTVILTKGGKRCLRDLNLFKKFNKIKIGASLTCLQKTTWFEYELGAADPLDRLETLRILKENNIETWASLEPVLDPRQTWEIIELTHQYVDSYKIGKLNYVKNNINWAQFLKDCVALMRKYNKRFYIKKNLLLYAENLVLHKNEVDMNYLTLKGDK